MEEVRQVLESEGHGFLGFEEFVRWMEIECHETGRENEERQMEELREAFRMYEMEGSGSITPKSLKRMLNRLGHESTSLEDCCLIIARFDVNGDGVLSFNEFKLMML